ncbi:hypothetical protein LINPERPRIM_LOCUS30973, partial [Linum perenne]
FSNVPPDVISVEGVSWLCSLIGKPVKQFIRDGLNVKVCIMRDKACICPEVISLEMEEDVTVNIDVVQMKEREYNSGPKRVWKVTKDQRKSVKIVEPNGAGEPIIVDKEHEGPTQDANAEGDKDPGHKEGGIPGTPKGLQILVENMQVSPVAEPIEKLSSNETVGTSNSKGKKWKKRKSKNGGGGESQSSSLPVVAIHSGNEVASSKEGTASPVSDGHDQVTGGGIGNASKASLEVEEAPIQHATRMSPAEDPLDGNLTDCTEEELLIAEHSGRKATLGDFFPVGKPLVSKQKNVVSGVKTRFKNKHR